MAMSSVSAPITDRECREATGLTALDGAGSRLQAEVGALANDMFAAAAGVGRSITSRLRSNVR